MDGCPARPLDALIGTIGATTWNTSIFPDKAAESYVLPVKKEVRTRENLYDGDAVEVTLQLASST